MKFNKYPTIKVSEEHDQCNIGWPSIFNEIKKTIDSISYEDKTIVVECYQGVHLDELRKEISPNLPGIAILDASDYMKSEDEIRKLTFPDVTNDRVFGKITKLEMHDFFLDNASESLMGTLKEIKGIKLIFGIGASVLLKKPDVLVYADMARWEIQQRMRRNEVDTIGITDRHESIEKQYKRAYFVDWRICDALKKELLSQWDFVLDTNNSNEPKLAKGTAVRSVLEKAINQPFSVVPFFDKGPWGGQWMKEKFDLDKSSENYAWCFNCVPEENSLLIEFSNTNFEIPSLNVVFYEPEALLGSAVYKEFGAEFPIRFDFLDTMGGGNLSLQVHPLKDYIKDQFGMDYTQDESYYMLDAGEHAFVYLGMQDNVDSEQMIEDLKAAQLNGTSFDADKYSAKWPAKKHDHFLIPAGTVHCSGEDAMVLEISATPYIFTFKLWDWGRLGMDGRPRPISIEHGKKVIQWDRNPEWTQHNLINQFEETGSGKGWVEEKTGLHALEFIETRRQWFDTKVQHNTENNLNVLMLIDGEQAVVESPDQSFDPFEVNYAEAFIVPARVGAYTITPSGISKGNKIAIIKAFVKK